MRQQAVDIKRFAAAEGARQIGVIFGGTQAEWPSPRSEKPRSTASPVAIFHSAVARSSCNLRMRRKILEGQHVARGQCDDRFRIAGSGQFAESAQHRERNLRRRGCRSRRQISGRSAARRNSTSSKALAVGESPDTRIRPVPSFRWEATREKAGSFSTSAKSSRTKGRSMQGYFSRRLSCEAEHGKTSRRFRVRRAEGGCPHMFFLIFPAAAAWSNTSGRRHR